jgi:hypothetical protein
MKPALSLARSGQDTLDAAEQGCDVVAGMLK